jgi:hypothetical protein
MGIGVSESAEATGDRFIDEEEEQRKRQGIVTLAAPARDAQRLAAKRPGVLGEMACEFAGPLVRQGISQPLIQWILCCGIGCRFFS